MDFNSFSSIGGNIRAFSEVVNNDDGASSKKLDPSRVRYINLHNNKLRDLRGLEKCHRVETINFSANELTLAVPASVGSSQSHLQQPWNMLQCLKKLDLACNRLRCVRTESRIKLYWKKATATVAMNILTNIRRFFFIFV